MIYNIDMEIVLGLISGLAWTLVYVEIIKQGHKDKVCGMPLIALGLNIVWEILYTWRGFLNTTISPQTWINLTWAILDVIILRQCFKYGENTWPKKLKGKLFKFWIGMVLLMSVSLQIAFLNEFGKMGPVYSAFLQNLLMSGLFINMLINNGSKGQNKIIGWAKWIGTVAPTILFGVIKGNQLVIVVGLFCSILDLIYIWLINKETKIK